jgi:hypothetical protein
MKMHITEIDDKRITLDPDAEYIQTELGSVSYQNGRILILSAITSKVVQITPIKRNRKPTTERLTYNPVNPKRSHKSNIKTPYF